MLFANNLDYFLWVLFSMNIPLNVCQPIDKWTAVTFRKNEASRIVKSTEISRTDLPSWRGSNTPGEDGKRRTDSDGTLRWGTLHSEIFSPPGKRVQLIDREPNTRVSWHPAARCSVQQAYVTGFLNPVPVSSAEHRASGDCSFNLLQNSKRPAV